MTPVVFLFSPFLRRTPRGAPTTAVTPGQARNPDQASLSASSQDDMNDTVDSEGSDADAGSAADTSSDHDTFLDTSSDKSSDSGDADGAVRHRWSRRGR